MANYTILLIDYEPRSIERFRDPLVGAGYTIEIATDGVSGIEAFHRLNPDMVLVEAMIPKKHGFEVCQELKRTPHGRKTPVIITTGVYKGRKYRTQALHIYGCDEYIEKPIAPEQLLELVGKFLKPGSSGSPPKSTERGPGQSGPGPTASQNTGSSGTKSVTTKPTLAPHALSPGDSDDEISAHLDAILWGTGPAAPEAVAGVGTTLTAAVDPIAANPPELDAAPDDDPFAEIRAELNAVLGPPPPLLEFDPVPLQSVPDFFPSDQLPPPSILEALPIPEAEPPSPEADLPTLEEELPIPEMELPAAYSELPIPAIPEPPPIALAERPGQVVDFDTKRSRKNKKSKHGKARSGPVPTSHSTPSMPMAAPEEAPAARALEPVASVAELTLPRGSVVESELEAPVANRGIPVWVWAVAGIIAVIGMYFIFSRDTPDRSVASAPSAASTDSAVSTTSEPPPAPEAVVPEAIAPEGPAPQTPDPAPVRAEPPTPVAETQPPPAPKKQADRPTKPKVVAPPPVAASAARADSPPVRSAPKIESPAAPRPVPVAPAAPDGLGVSVAGVETLPDPAAAAAPTFATGALIPIDEADTMPVSLLRRSPVYSEQARQMKASGTVIMNVLINERGSVDQAVLVTGVPVADLNDAAIRAAKTWTYRPATKNGVPVKVWKSEQIVFKR